MNFIDNEERAFYLVFAVMVLVTATYCSYHAGRTDAAAQEYGRTVAVRVLSEMEGHR